MSDGTGTSIVVKGEGPFIGFFITEGMRRFPKADWFDRTSRARKAIAFEQRLVRKGLVSSRIGHKPRQSFRPHDERAAGITVHFVMDRIRVSHGLDCHSLPTGRVSSMAELTAVVERAFRIMDRMLN